MKIFFHLYHLKKIHIKAWLCNATVQFISKYLENPELDSDDSECEVAVSFYEIAQFEEIKYNRRS